MFASTPVRIALIGASLLVVAGCASRPAPAPVAIPGATGVAPAAAALAPAAYMQLAASSALFAVRASDLVAQRTGDARLREVARAIAQDQRGIGSQLNFAGRRLDLLPSAALTSEQAADLSRLESVGDVDKLYRQVMDPVLTRAAQLHAAFAVRGSSPTLRPVAQMAAPATRRNLQQLRRR